MLALKFIEKRRYLDSGNSGFQKSNVRNRGCYSMVEIQCRRLADRAKSCRKIVAGVEHAFSQLRPCHLGRHPAINGDMIALVLRVIQNGIEQHRHATRLSIRAAKRDNRF